MHLSALTPRFAWLPFTPRGVAAFARARLRRLFLVQLLVAFVAVGAGGWLMRTAFLPGWHTALAALPAGARLEAGRLVWPAPEPVLLAETPFLSVAVDLAHSGRLTPDAHLRLQFGERDWRVASVLGTLDIDSFDTRYPANYDLPLDRASVEPWWEAREIFLLLGFLGAAGLALLGSWWLLATLYAPAAWLVGLYTNRELSWSGSWKLAAAALLPGALFLSGALVLYGLRVFGLGQLALAWGLHLLLGWLYLAVSPLFLPRVADLPSAGKNPFGSSDADRSEASSSPFRGPR
ncbi:MAG: hypothetical protein ACK45B_15770 [Limisphaerales bacterium]|jgi:hypothetical protein